MPAYTTANHACPAPAQFAEPSASAPIQLNAAVVAIWQNEITSASRSLPNVSMTRICAANSTALPSNTKSARVTDPNPSVMHSR